MKRTILIVDDDDSVRQTLSEVLAVAGYETIEAASGEEAIAIAMSRHIDSFLLDMEMPHMSGVEVCRTIRKLGNYRTTPIIFVTGVEENWGLAEAFDAGADDLISKPPNVHVIRARLKGHLQRMEYFQRLERARKVLQQYLSKRTLEVVESTSLTGTLRPPEERDLAICFTDMRNFTAFAEEMEPNRLFDLVSSLLAEQVAIVHKNGGYVDKFGGDGVMAIFDGPEMVVQSCICALDILDSEKIQNAAIAADIRRFGIGIHTGRAVIGNIGSPEHLDYSAIGSAVNLAARLCGQAEATSIIVSKAVRDAVPNEANLRFHSERKVVIRGVREPVTVYTLSRQ
jgi:class 3 adenylate cyclase